MSVFFERISLSVLRKEYGDQGLDCPICLTSLKNPIMGHEGVGPTRHALHKKCFDQYAKIQLHQFGEVTCSLCRGTVANFTHSRPIWFTLRDKVPSIWNGTCKAAKVLAVVTISASVGFLSAVCLQGVLLEMQYQNQNEI